MLSESIKITPKSTPQGRIYTAGKSSLRQNEAVLVKKNDEGDWEPVRELEGPIDRFEMQDNHAIWRDQQVHTWKDVDVRSTNGRPRILREKDGIVDSDEIHRFGMRDFEDGFKKDLAITQSPFGKMLDGGMEVGTELIAEGDGFAFQTTNLYGDEQFLVTKDEIEGFKAYVQDDSNWQVARP